MNSAGKRTLQAEDWTLAQGWRVETRNGVEKLQGLDDARAFVKVSREWSNASFACRLKLVSGRLDVCYRAGVAAGYVIGLSEQRLTLEKKCAGGGVALLAKTLWHQGFAEWQELFVAIEDERVLIQLNGETAIDFYDPDPIGAGDVALLTHEETQAYVSHAVLAAAPAPDFESGFNYSRGIYSRVAVQTTVENQRGRMSRWSKAAPGSFLQGPAKRLPLVIAG